MRFMLPTLMSILLAGGAKADPVIGTWLTEPDRHGVVAHVQVYGCDEALCGRIARTFDAAGREIVTPNLGKRIFWNVRPKGQGAYKGRAWVPAHNRQYDAGMTLSKNRLTVHGCLGPVCMSQRWARVN